MKPLVNVKSPFAIVHRWVARTNMTDEHKATSFIYKVKDKLEEVIEGHLQAIENLKYNHKVENRKLTSAVINADEALTNAYDNIPLESIKDNASQENFVMEYLTSIDECQMRLIKAKEAKKYAQDQVDTEVKALKAKIKVAKENIDVICVAQPEELKGE